MTSAFKSLKSGLKADIQIMNNRNFCDVDENIIHDIFMTMRITKIGYNTLQPIHWLEAWRLYGLHSYCKINDYLEKHLSTKQRHLLHMDRLKKHDDKCRILRSYISLPPALRRKSEEALVVEGLDNDFLIAQGL